MKVFGSVIYQTFLGFVKRSVKVKKTDFRADSDLIGHVLIDKSVMD